MDKKKKKVVNLQKIEQIVSGFNNHADNQLPYLEIKEVQLYCSQDTNYYQPEVEIIKEIFKTLMKETKLEIIEIKQESIEQNELPFLRFRLLDELVVYRKSEFMKIVKYLFLDNITNPQNNRHLYVVEQCTGGLYDCQQYYSFVEPARKYQYLNRYWLIWNPFLKCEEIQQRMQVCSELRNKGLVNQKIVVDRTIQKLHNIQQCLFRNGMIDHDRQSYISQIVCYHFINNIIVNNQDSEVVSQMNKQCDWIMDFMDQIQQKRLGSDSRELEQQSLKVYFKQKEKKVERKDGEGSSGKVNKYLQVGIVLGLFGGVMMSE